MADIIAPASRNALCPCGSGKRYKQCHGLIAPSHGAPAAVRTQADRVLELMGAALAAQQAEDVVNAARLYDEALTLDPLQPDALHMRGVVALTMGQLTEALGFIDRAIATGFDNPSIRYNRFLVEQAIEEARANRANIPHFISAIEEAASIPRSTQDEYVDDVRILAYYLPQFHRISENDDWWGLGFTEWTNVRKAAPNFPGHNQPRIPLDADYYDLLDPRVRQRQAEQARAHGVDGFCYYYYWFKGRRLLEQPLNAVLQSGEPDFPFCVFWANEDWVRSWDGGNREVLVKQEHSDEDDENFIAGLLPLFADKRYIRVRQQPLLMIYRVDNLPNPSRTFDRWRSICLAAGEMPPYIVTADTTASALKPYVTGADASVEFPPHRTPTIARADYPVGVREGWQGAAFDQRILAAFQATRAEPDHTHFRTVTPAWDNTARRQHDGTMFLHASPQVFRVWLRETLLRARRRLPAGQRLVFVNAWNEWAEGAYLEPDEHWGHAMLEAVRDARYIPEGWPELIERIARHRAGDAAQR